MCIHRGRDKMCFDGALIQMSINEIISAHFDNAVMCPKLLSGKAFFYKNGKSHTQNAIAWHVCAVAVFYSPPSVFTYNATVFRKGSE